MSSIKRVSKIQIEELDSVHFFESLLQVMGERQLLSEKEMEVIQRGIGEVLQTMIFKFHSGESSSIRIEEASELADALFYNISQYLKSLIETDDMIEAIKTESVSKLYEMGIERIKGKMQKGAKLLKAIQRNSLTLQNIAYHDVIDKALPHFFLYYDYRLASQENEGMLTYPDYPISIDTMKHSGIEYILPYMTKLWYENEFCNRFTPESIYQLLYAYSYQFEDLIINIFNLVLTNAIGCILCKKPAVILDITKEERAQIECEFASLDNTGLRIVLLEAMDRLIEELQITQPFLKSYIKANEPTIRVLFNKALENQTLSDFFLSFAKE